MGTTDETAPQVPEETLNEVVATPEPEKSTAAPTENIELPEEDVAPAPGTGIDTDGDGNADHVITQEGDEVDIDDVTEIQHPEFDYTNKVRLSDVYADAVDKDEAKTAVEKSGVYDKYKRDLTDQIDADDLTPPYKDMLRKIMAAYYQGSAYTGTL